MFHLGNYDISLQKYTRKMSHRESIRLKPVVDGRSMSLEGNKPIAADIRKARANDVVHRSGRAKSEDGR